ncbi:MAG: malonate transporter subunit MadL [Flavobacteriaceae bacterium]|jgi:malonate transporter MadL subunit|nr:malonate transporter subunit MadL [Flavobacteriaceae bacterium]
MKIYGVALLVFCFLIGKYLGGLLAELIGISGDVGGVGFAMLLLMFANGFLKRFSWYEVQTKAGVLFWSSMYIPVIVAMAATRNVHAAISGGWTALIAGVAVTLVGFMLVPLLSKIRTTKQESDGTI